MKYYISIILLSFISSGLWGQDQVCQNLGWNSNSQYPDIYIEVPNDIHNLVNYKIETTEINIRVAIEKDGVFPYGNGADFELSFNLSGMIKDIQGNVILNAQGNPVVINHSIILSSDKSEAIFNVKVPSPVTTESSNPYNLTSNTIYVVEGLLITTSGTGVTSTTTAPIDLIDNMLVEVCQSMDIRVDVGTTSSNSFLMLDPQLRAIPYHSNGAPYYDFEWDALSTTTSVNKYSPFYEFQLLKLENTELDPVARTNEKHIKTTVDWTNALSFVVPEDKINQGGFYKLRFRPSEGEGYYLWRVRPIGSYYEGGVAQNLNWGKWSDEGYTLTNGFIELGGTTPSTSFDRFYYEDPDEEDNYLYSRTFTENGQVYESMTYADKLLRPRQTQSYLPNENSNDAGKTVVGQTLYDQLGRSSISVIPVPVDGYMNGYKDKFVENVSNELYSLEDYGVDTKLYDPEKVSTDGAYQYYSNDNLEDLTIPDAQGYPFIRTIYSNDGLNRVSEQSGIGETHMVGTRADGRGRTTTTEVQVGVADAELVSIFGVEAPNPDHVVKQIVTDPNGTTSITYTSKSGKTLATALSEPYDPDGDYPLTAIDNANINSLELVESLNLGQFQGDRFSNSKTIILAQAAPDFLITYKAPGCGAPNTLPLCLQSAFSGCSYEVTVRVEKLTSTGNEPVNSNPIYTSPQTTVSGCTPVTITTLNLPKGTYKIIKEVKLGNDNVATLINDYQAEVSNQIAAYMELIGLLLDQVQNTSDWVKIDNAVDAVNIYLTSSRTLTDQQNLEAALDVEFNGAFDNFIFSRLDPLSGSFGEVVVGMEYEADLDPNITGFPNEDMDEIKLLLQDCEGDPSELSSEIKKEKNKLNLQQQSPYKYKPAGTSISPVKYDYPPFVEYFLDEVDIDLSTFDPIEFAKFFEGYNYWDHTIQPQGDWAPIDAAFVTKYINAVNFANSPGGNTDALKILNANQFNRMVWHMLNDEYYPEEVKYDGASNKYLYFDETSGLWKDFITDQSTLNTTQYDVEDLTTCWKNLVNVFGQMNANAGAITGPASGEFDDDINDAPAGSQDFDGLKDNIPWIIKFLFGDQLDDAMGDAQSAGGVQPFGNLPLSPTYLPQQFLECTGTKYARVIDFVLERDARDHTITLGPQGTAASLIFNTYDVPLIGDQTTTTQSISIGSSGYTKGSVTIPGYTDEIAEYYGDYGIGKERLELDTDYEKHSIAQLPFVQNPVFAFKYYEYWNRSSSNLPHPWDGQTWLDEDNSVTCTLNIVGNAAHLDRPFSCILCEEAYAYNQITGTCTPSTTGHDEWSNVRRSKFLSCIRNISNADGLGFPLNAEIDCNNPIIRLDDDCDLSPNAIAIEVNQMVSDCEDACENRRDEFREQVIEMFERACWQVGQCSIPNTATTDIVSTTEIEAVVDKLILECKGQCNVQVPDAADFQSISCVTNVGGVTIEYCDIPELDRCELLLRDIALHWKIELHIEAPDGVTCSGNSWNDPVPSVNDEPVCDPSTSEPNYLLNRTQEVEITVPSN